MKKSIQVLSFIILTLSLWGCLPQAPKYPYTESSKADDVANKLSQDLEAYIKLWYGGHRPALLPDSLLPKGYDFTRYANLRLVKFEDINVKQQWVVRPAHKIDFNALYGSFPDPNCTYLFAPIMYAPFGATLHIEGDFPYCRFFSVQASPPFDAHEYRYDKWAGKAEVGVVDCDIPAKAGNVNPFKANGDRTARNRA